MKVKDIVYHYEIKLDFMNDCVEQTNIKHTVLGINRINLVIDDFSFTTIPHTKQYRWDKETLFNEVGVYNLQVDGCFDQIRAYLYTSSTSKKIVTKRMKKALEKFINKKHGRYCNATTLLSNIEI